MKEFQGDKKVGASFLTPWEDHLRVWLLPRVPRRIETYHLTLSTIIWCLVIVAASFLAKHNIHWLWLSSAMIAMQYLTDLLDGAVGRQRDTGLVKWGYYMDHFLDYIFLCSILIGYALLLPDAFKHRLFFVMALFGAFMVNSFLSFAATSEFKISYLGIGPTEVRIVFILVNTALILFGKTYMLRAMPYVMCGATFGLFVTVYKTQCQLWRIDMCAKRGDAPQGATDGEPTASEIAHELTDGLSKRRIARNILLSLLLAAASVVVLAMKVLYPWHRAVAAALYIAGWLLFLLSFRQKRAVLKKRREALRKKLGPYVLHAAVAVALLIAARVSWLLVPAEVSALARVSDSDLLQNIRHDMENVHIVNQNFKSLLNWADESGLLVRPVEDLSPQDKQAIRSFWCDFVEASMEMEVLKKKYMGFYQIDYLVKPHLHANAFLIAYAAFVTQYQTSQRVEEALAHNPFLRSVLDEEHADRGIPPDSFSQMQRHLAHPDELLRLNAGAVYINLVKKDIQDPYGLAAVTQSGVRQIFRGLGKSPERLVESPLNLIEKIAFTAWFPFQKEAATRMSEIRTKHRDNFVSPALIAEHMNAFEPGDIMLERRNWYMTNVGIPGFWPHAALYVGTPEQMDDHFKGLALLDGGSASAYVASNCPAAFRKLTARTDAGAERRVLEAIRDGVVFTALETSANADYLAVLRPRVSREDKFRAVLGAMSHVGKPYDYNFDFATDGALVCSELIYKSYSGVPGLTFDLTTINGRLILPPNMIAKKFADEYGTETRQMDLVLFLDGSEAMGRAVPRDAEAFAASFDRPKWDVMQE